jgi:hypothetical protein
MQSQTLLASFPLSFYMLFLTVRGLEFEFWGNPPLKGAAFGPRGIFGRHKMGVFLFVLFNKNVICIALFLFIIFYGVWGGFLAKFSNC